MQIKVRRVNGMLSEVIVEDGKTRIELGLLDEQERKQLAETLREAADELDPQDCD